MTTRPDEIDDEDGDEQTPDVVRQRNQIKVLDAEVKALREDNLKHAFTEAGFDPEKGEGKLLLAAYRGERSKDAILEWAEKEYGLKPPTVEGEGKAPARSEPEQTQVAFEARLARARQESKTVPLDADKMNAALAEAREHGDVVAEVALLLHQWEQTKT